jgi:hypothetical protein
MDRTDAIRARDHQSIIARLRPHVDRSPLGSLGARGLNLWNG